MIRIVVKTPLALGWGSKERHPKKSKKDQKVKQKSKKFEIGLR